MNNANYFFLGSSLSSGLGIRLSLKSFRSDSSDFIIFLCSSSRSNFRTLTELTLLSFISTRVCVNLKDKRLVEYQSYTEIHYKISFTVVRNIEAPTRKITSGRPALSPKPGPLDTLIFFGALFIPVLSPLAR